MPGYFESPLVLLALPVTLALVYLLGRGRLSRLPHGAADAAMVVRLVATAALVLALARPVILAPRDDLAVAFLVDRSASVDPEASRVADGWVDAAMAAAGPHDRGVVVHFGGRPAVAARQSSGTYTTMAPVDPLQTNTRSALRFAEALLGPSGARRVVIVGDGNDNAGGAGEEAAALARLGAQVSAVLLPSARAGVDGRVDGIAAPRHVWIDQQFLLVASVHSPATMPGDILVEADGQLISRERVTLEAGANDYSVRVAPKTEGVHSYRVGVVLAGDVVPENDWAAMGVTVHPPGRALVVGADVEPTRAVVELLRANRLEVATALPAALSLRISDYEPYDVVVLCNVPASAVPADQARTLVAAVDALGIGLVAIGGDASFSLGGYNTSPLADALPVQMTVPGTAERGPVAIVLVIDKSGSMDIREENVRKVEMARRAAEKAVALLGLNDIVGVIAFDSSPQVLVPVQRIGDETNRGILYELIGRLEASGGTDVQAALGLAIDLLANVRSDRKHVILFSDGQSGNAGPYDDLLRELRSRRITLSAIAIGGDADVGVMEELATTGQGRYYFAEQAKDIPSITVRETRIASGLTKVDEAIGVRIGDPSPLLFGFAETDLPDIRGYVVTVARDGATVGLASTREDPLLVHWQYGLGRVVAWTSDVGGQWGTGWLSSEASTRLWGQVARWAMRTPGGARAQLTAASTGLSARLTVDIVDGAGAYQDLLDVRADVAGSGYRSAETRLTQTQPGRYEGQFDVPAPGAYGVRLTWRGEDGIVRDALDAFVVPYSPEYAVLDPDRPALEAVARAGGGRLLGAPAEAFARDLAFPARAPRPIERELLLLACILLPVDVAIRRLKLSPAAIRDQLGRITRPWLAGRLGSRTRRSGRLR